MAWRLVTDTEIRNLPVPEKMFAYATSYARGAIALCDELAQSSAYSWPDGAVVLMMSSHATELFLKAMLLKRVPEELVWDLGHDLESAWEGYCLSFPEPEYQWDIPFKTVYSAGITPAQKAEFQKMRDAHQSILFRYPVDKKTGKDWKGLYAFEPNLFIPVLRKMKDDFRRVWSVAV